jgi:cell division protein FtsX
MNFIIAVFTQTFRNLFQTWSAQLLTLITITLSVLIFAFFYLIYTNVQHAGQQLDDDLRLVIYLDEEPAEEMQEEPMTGLPASLRKTVMSSRICPGTSCLLPLKYTRSAP